MRDGERKVLRGVQCIGMERRHAAAAVVARQNFKEGPLIVKCVIESMRFTRSSVDSHSQSHISCSFNKHDNACFRRPK